MTVKKRGRPAKVKQGHLPGLEPPSIREIDDAAEAYYELNDESWKMRGKVEEARDNLLTVMKRHHLNLYRYEDKEVLVVGKQVVKVKKKKAAEED